jgi:transcriptional antiterminator Rof (Rho-off)
MDLDRAYWDALYANAETAWDLGGPSTPLKAYIDQLSDRDLEILIPGAGRAYEAEYLHRSGFRNVHVVDLSDAPFRDLLARCPDFPQEHLHAGDFFQHEGRYDRILEQTFFCALDPAVRPRYVERMHHLLKPEGKLVGVLFDDTLGVEGPPFGGSAAEYALLFGVHFPGVTFERCYNSIKPRAGRELWMKAVKEAAYTPIDCSLYDHYEAAATLKQQVQLTLADGSTAEGRITDLFIQDAAEHLRLDNGRTIRLDRITGLAVR